MSTNPHHMTDLSKNPPLYQQDSCHAGSAKEGDLCREKESQLKAIYENYADKTISFGCVVKLEMPDELQVYPEPFKEPQHHGNGFWYSRWTIGGVESDSSGNIMNYIMHYGHNGESNTYKTIKCSLEDLNIMVRNSKIKIIGHPLTLSQIFYVMQNLELVPLFMEPMSDGENSDIINFRVFSFGIDTTKCYLEDEIEWKLNQALDGQPKETIDFLYDILN